MNINTVNYSKLNEALHIYEHSSGLKAFVIPKKGYSKKYATFATHYGSINNRFVAPGENEETLFPTLLHIFLSTSCLNKRTAA
jgi:hypothetical protein